MRKFDPSDMQRRRPEKPVAPTHQRPVSKPVNGSANTSAAKSPEKLANGFYPSEASLLRDALGLAQFRWFDGQDGIMGKKGQFELMFTPGEAGDLRWGVMSFPLIDMNLPQAPDICMHFLAESHTLIHVLEHQYQVGINMQTEQLVFMMQIPVQSVSAAQLGEVISTFFDALSEAIAIELQHILNEMGES